MHGRGVREWASADIGILFMCGEQRAGGRATVIDLSCGAGGLSYGFERAGCDVLLGIDSDAKALETFELNHESAKTVCGDITRIEYARDIKPLIGRRGIDIVVGGPPCQGMSLSGPRKFEDPRNRLYLSYIRLVSEIRPKAFVIENVPGLVSLFDGRIKDSIVERLEGLGYAVQFRILSADDYGVLQHRRRVVFVGTRCDVKGILSANRGEAFPIIVKSLRDCGYHVTHMLLNASRYGVPQRRERVFIVGFRDRDVMERFSHPAAETSTVTLGEVVASECDVPPKYYFSERAVAGMRAAKPEMNKGRVQALDRPCSTVGAHLCKVSLNGTDPVMCVNGRYRRFMPSEVARIQSFPESYRLVGSERAQYKALGNAIPPVLAWHVMKSICEAFRIV